MDCKNCSNYREFKVHFQYDKTTKTTCLNYKPKLPKVTLQEVGQLYWKHANVFGKLGCSGMCEELGLIASVSCSGNCRTIECFAMIRDAVNKERGY